jgi:protein gp37
MRYSRTLGGGTKEKPIPHWGKNAARYRTSEQTWKQPLIWDKEAKEQGKHANVFCASSADVFEQHDTMPLDEWRIELHERLIEKTPNLHWLLLTKRPENIAKFYGARPIPQNVWLGVSVENQEMAEKRIPLLLENEASVCFLSCEPLLGPLDLSPWLSRIQWVIVGGESGPAWRPMKQDWVIAIREQCKRFGVPFFFKQWGGGFKSKGGRLLEGREWNEMPAPKTDGAPTIKGSLLAFKIGEDGKPKVLKTFQNETERLALIGLADATLRHYRNETREQLLREDRL